jgi:broad specificity phosphatase PhoE
MTSIIARVRVVSAVVLLMLAIATRVSAQGASTTVIVVRHAEKAAVPANDPPLTAEGKARSRDLVEALRNAGVTAVITTQFLRTRDTGQPLASALSITAEVVPTSGATHVADVVAAVRRHAGQTVLVVGHSNTVPAIVEALGAAKPAAMCDAEYDNLYIVTIRATGNAGVIHSRFGVRTPVDASCAAVMK